VTSGADEDRSERRIAPVDSPFFQKVYRQSGRTENYNERTNKFSADEFYEGRIRRGGSSGFAPCVRRRRGDSLSQISGISLTSRKFMRILKSFLCLLIFASIIPAQQEAIVPIASDYYLLGGSKDGKWVTAEIVAPTTEKRTKMIRVSLKGIEKGDAILNNTGEDSGACPENKMMRLEPETQSGFAVGANAKWNLVPRTPKLVRVTDKNYRKIAAEFLRTKGIAKTKIKLSQIIQVDLEGDGQTEVLITGNFYKKGIMETQTAGDYSFALLRKVVKGRVRNILIEGDFITRRGYYDPPNEREILAVADLNGDGRMEIVLDTFYYEGNWKQVFEIKGTKLSKVLEVSCLV
jgi:hypothetical protein